MEENFSSTSARILTNKLWIWFTIQIKSTLYEKLEVPFRSHMRNSYHNICFITLFMRWCDINKWKQKKREKLLPSLHIGGSLRPLLLISVASSKVSPSGTRLINRGYTGVTGFHSITGNLGRVLQLYFRPRNRNITPPLLYIIFPPVFSYQNIKNDLSICDVVQSMRIIKHVAAVQPQAIWSCSSASGTFSWQWVTYRIFMLGTATWLLE